MIFQIRQKFHLNLKIFIWYDRGGTIYKIPIIIEMNFEMNDSIVQRYTAQVRPNAHHPSGEPYLSWWLDHRIISYCGYEFELFNESGISNPSNRPCKYSIRLSSPVNGEILNLKFTFSTHELLFQYYG